MSAETALVAILKADVAVAALVATRVYPLTLPVGCELPAISYQRIDGNPINSLDGYSGSDRPRIQVDCWGCSYAESKDLGAKVKSALTGSSTITATVLDDRDNFNKDTGIGYVSTDFNIRA